MLLEVIRQPLGPSSGRKRMNTSGGRAADQSEPRRDQEQKQVEHILQTLGAGPQGIDMLEKALDVISCSTAC